MDSVEVNATMAGVPVSFVHDGRTWHIAAEPVRWFERMDWWKTAQRMERGTGRIDIEVWQVQARIGRNLRSALVTFELVRTQDRQSWSIRSMETIAA